ncbi:hypothetical protein ACEPAI_3071 [Sanghuangporus weigelae]
MPLLSLPEEILLAALSYLNGTDILAFAFVNKYTNNFYKTSSRLQYIAELDLAGCLDESLDAPRSTRYAAGESNGKPNEAPSTAATSSPSISEKLAYLRMREHNWRSLDLTRNAKKIPLEREMEVSVYDLSGGVFGFAEFRMENLLRYVELREVSRREGILDGSGDAQGQPGDQGDEDNIADAENENAVRNVEENFEPPRTDVPWKELSLDGIVADFGLALREHDLVVSVSYSLPDQGEELLNLPAMQEIKLNLYQFSTQSPHPLAKEPTIKLARKPTAYARPSPIIEVSGMHIVVLLTFPRSVLHRSLIEDLFVINWQTGTIVHHQSYETPTYFAIAFVTPSLFVLPNLVENTLDLLHIFASEGGHAGGADSVVLLRRLHLPEMTNNFKLRSAVCRGDPNPTASTFDPLNPHSNASTAETEGLTQDRRSSASMRRWGTAGYDITADPLRAIISFKFVIEHSDAAVPYGPALNLIVHRSALTSLALPVLNACGKHVLENTGTGEGNMTSGNILTGADDVQWKEWGPKATRWRLEDDYVGWVTTTAGQRQVFMSLVPGPDNTWWKSVVVVRDYNPFEVKRTMAKAVRQRADERTAKKGKGKALDLNDLEGGNDIEIHVDSLDGEREDDSEDEDEFGLGTDRDWPIGNIGLSQTPMPTPGPPPAIDEMEVHLRSGGLLQAVDADEAGDGNPTEYHPLDGFDEPEPEPGSSPAVPQLPPPSASSTLDANQSGPGIPPASSVTANTIASPSHTEEDSEQNVSDATSSSSSPPLPPQSSDVLFTTPSFSHPLELVSIRIRDTTSTTKVRYYQDGDLAGGLPCVEYMLEGCEALFSGVLMDEERIIGRMRKTRSKLRGCRRCASSRCILDLRTGYGAGLASALRSYDDLILITYTYLTSVLEYAQEDYNNVSL